MIPIMSKLSSRALSRLRWLSSAKTGAAAVLQNIVARFGMYGVNLACGVLTARNLGPTGRGEQGAMFIWPQTLCYLLTFGVPFALIYQVRIKPASRDSLITSSLIISILLGFLALAIGIIFMPLWLHQYSTSTIRFAQAIMLSAPIIMFSLNVTSVLDGSLDFATGGIIRYVPSLVTLGALLVLAKIHRFTPQSSVLAYVLPAAVVVLLVWPKVKSHFSFRLEGFRPSSILLLQYGLKVYGSNVLGTIGAQLDTVLVLGFLSATSLGTYSVGLNFSRTVLIVATATSLVLLPKVAGATTPEVVRRVGIALRATLLGSLAIALSLVAIMPILLPRLYGRDFGRSVNVAQILVVEATLAAAITVLLQSFLAANRPAIATILQGVGLATALPLMVILIPRLGILGAAISLLASTSLRFVFILISYPVVLKLPAPSIILSRADLREIRMRVQRR